MAELYSYEDCKYLHKKLWHALGTMSKEELKARMHIDPLFLKNDMVDSIVVKLSFNKEFYVDDITPIYDCWACEVCSTHCSDCPIKWGGKPNRCTTEVNSKEITAYDIFLEFLHIGVNPKWLHAYPVYAYEYTHFTLWPDLPIVVDDNLTLDPNYYDFYGTVYANNEITIDELVDIYYDEYVEACLWIRDAWK